MKQIPMRPRNAGYKSALFTLFIAWIFTLITRLSFAFAIVDNSNSCSVENMDCYQAMKRAGEKGIVTQEALDCYRGISAKDIDGYEEYKNKIESALALNLANLEKMQQMLAGLKSESIEQSGSLKRMEKQGQQLLQVIRQDVDRADNAVKQLPEISQTIVKLLWFVHKRKIESQYRTCTDDAKQLQATNASTHKIKIAGI